MEIGSNPFSINDISLVPEKVHMKRSASLRAQCLELNNSCCEIDVHHESFISNKTHRNYMETHHIIPLGVQNFYDNKLDCISNLSCLCPICHRQIHYGRKEDKLPILKKLYNTHTNALKKSGIEVESFSSILIYY